VLNLVKGPSEAGSAQGRAAGQTLMTPQAVTLTLGLESAEGYEGSVWNDVFHRYWVKAVEPPLGTGRFARMFGALNVRYVTTSIPYGTAELLDPAPEDPARDAFPEDPSAHPWWADGPYVYENEHCAPRAHRPTRTLFVVGDEPRVFEELLELSALEDFEPAAVAFVALPGAALFELGADAFEVADGILFCGFHAGGYEPGALRPLVDSFESRGGRVFSLPRDREEGRDGPIAAFLRERPTPAPSEESRAHSVESIAWTPRDPNGFTIRCGASESPRVVVVSEKAALHRGWTAKAGGFADGAAPPIPILRADGVVSAVVVPRGVDSIDFDYEAPGYRRGLAVSLPTLGLVALLGLVLLSRAFPAVVGAGLPDGGDPSPVRRGSHAPSLPQSRVHDPDASRAGGLRDVP
jgi:hypothetical protein